MKDPFKEKITGTETDPLIQEMMDNMNPQDINYQDMYWQNKKTGTDVNVAGVGAAAPMTKSNLFSQSALAKSVRGIHARRAAEASGGLK